MASQLLQRTQPSRLGCGLQERMKRFGKAVDEACERINAKSEKGKMELRMQQPKKSTQ